MPDHAAPSALSPREVAGQTLRRHTKGDHVTPWEQLSDTRRELWCTGADTVVLATLRTLSQAAAEVVARDLYEEHHRNAGTLTEWTMREWDHGGDQHVNKAPWIVTAKRLLSLVESTYRQNGHIVS